MSNASTDVSAEFLEALSSESDQAKRWRAEFSIHSAVDLDFIISQSSGLPVGMERTSPPEFRRRVLAARISYQLGLRSIDYALKRYVHPEEYEFDPASLGDEVSDFVRDSLVILKDGLKSLHTTDGITFGIFGAEFSLFKIPESLDSARMLANRGLFLEVLPILRSCLEMGAWAATAFFIGTEEQVVRLKAPTCISNLKSIYSTCGTLYGYLSRFSHWEFPVHSYFVNAASAGAAVIQASCRFRAMSLMLCLTILDVVLRVVGRLYATKADELIIDIQGTSIFDADRKTSVFLRKIAEFGQQPEFELIQSFLP